MKAKKGKIPDAVVVLLIPFFLFVAAFFMVLEIGGTIEECLKR